MGKLDRKHVSDLDTFLTELRNDIAESESQVVERTKHESIAKLRDKACPQNDEDDIWKGF